jgi:hypothetical protein
MPEMVLIVMGLFNPAWASSSTGSSIDGTPSLELPTVSCISSGERI